MKCYYHKSDFDGKCAGAIVKYKYPECEMIGVDYDETPPGVEKKEIVFVVDFCFPENVMMELNQEGVLIWIDHHETSIDKMFKAGIHPDGLRSNGFAACELTWKFLFPDDRMPRAVELLGRYDIWDHKDPGVLPFQYGMREVVETHPEAGTWPPLFREDFAGTALISHLVKTGEIILRYEKRQNEIIAKGMAYEATFGGLRAIVINKPFSNSKVFDSVYDPEKHDIMIIFGVKPGSVKYTLFSSKPEIHVGKIATIYGGGGHAGAAGFYTKTILKELLPDIE